MSRRKSCVQQQNCNVLSGFTLPFLSVFLFSCPDNNNTTCSKININMEFNVFETFVTFYGHFFNDLFIEMRLQFFTNLRIFLCLNFFTFYIFYDFFVRFSTNSAEVLVENKKVDENVNNGNLFINQIKIFFCKYFRFILLLFF